MTQSLDGELTVKQARAYLAKRGLRWTEIWIRAKCGKKTIKSRKKFNSRVIEIGELDRILKDKGLM